MLANAWSRSWLWLVALVAAAAGAVVAAVAPTLAIPLAAAVLVAVAIFQAPQCAAYLYAVTTPLVVGINRGALIPGVRVNEAVLAYIVCVVGARLYTDAVGGRVDRARFSRLDWSVLALVVAGSVLPAGTMWLRGLPLSADDISYALVLPKLGAVYAVLRWTVTTQAQVARVLILTIAANLGAAVIGLLQAIRFGPVLTLLLPYADPDNAGSLSAHHASSTLGSSLSLADLAAVSAGLSVSWFFVGLRFRKTALTLAVVFTTSALAAGEVSGVLGLLVVLAVVAVVLRKSAEITVGLLGTVLVALPVLVPVIGARLNDVDPVSGLPAGWAGDAGRLNNLTVYIWPHFSNVTSWLLGVDLAGRIRSPYSWGTWLYIESGYTWALWTGGVPLLLACIWFLWNGIRHCRALLAASRGALASHRVAFMLAIAGLTAFVQTTVLMVFDPHLTYRGSGDLLFSLIGLVGALVSASRPLLPEATWGVPEPVPVAQGPAHAPAFETGGRAAAS